jgi:hypothetical protein
LILLRSPASEDPTVLTLFDEWWRWTIAPGSLALLLSRQDDLLIAFSFLMRDFAEHQLARLPDDSVALLYNAFASLLLYFGARLTIWSSSVSREAHDEELSFQSDSSLLLLDILNLLSTKEFILDEDNGVAQNHISQQSSLLSIVSSTGIKSISLQDVPRILLFGLQTLLPLVSVDMLLSFPLLAERYLSFVVFLCGSHTQLLVIWLNEQERENRQTLTILVEQLVVGMTLTDAVAARMSLQVC